MMASNYHTHSCFCDGRDTPEELVREALRLGCPELGFSGHAYTAFSPDWCMSPEGTQRYREEVRRLQAVYEDRIRIYCGVEQDLYSSQPAEGYDYVIGAVHFLRRGGRYYTVDESREEQLQAVEEAFNGDFYAYAEAYYEAVARLWEETHCQIVAHLDLLSKFNETGDLFDQNHPRYRAAVLSALDTLEGKPVAVEINSGAMARGARRTPYPAPWILDELRRRGLPVILSADAHRKEQLLFAFSDCRALAEAHGLQLLQSVREIG